MLSSRNTFHYVRVLIVIGVVLAGTAGFFSTRVVARAAVPVDLTTLSDGDILAYRWEAMAQFYAGQPATQDLTTLSAAEVSVYRWQAMARFYAGQAAPTALTLP